MRKILNGMTITNKITLLYGCVFALVLLLTSVFLMLNATYYYRSVSRKELAETAERVAAHIEAGGALTAEALREARQNNLVEVRVTDMAGAPRGQTSADMPVIPFPPPPGGEWKARHEFLERTASWGGRIYHVQAFRENMRERQALRLFALVFVAANLVGLVGVFLIGKAISRAMLKPIVHMSQTAERISIEDLSRRIDVDGPDDEFRKLAVTFNEMIQRLETSFKKQNQFVSDASHELRTPISVIQGYANLLDRWGKTDPAVTQESIDSIKSETAHMSSLVEKLLFLAKDGPDTVGRDADPVSLAEVAEEVLKEFSLARERLVPRLSLETEADGILHADRHMMKRLIWIFLENAVKYGGDGLSRVTIRVAEDRGAVSLTVADDGAGIDPADLPHIFERFYRADKSRSREIPGTGLGLSIAKRIAERHSAHLSVESSPGEGAAFTVRFPRGAVENSFSAANKQ